jgi:hypothetical protein
LQEIQILRLFHIRPGIVVYSNLALALSFQFTEERLPYLCSRFGRERRVVYREIDPRDEGFVERANAVCCEKQNSLVVLHGTQKAGDKAVAFDVLHSAMLHEDIGLVDEKDGIPGFCALEEDDEIIFDLVRVSADVGACDCQKRALCIGRDALWLHEFSMEQVYTYDRRLTGGIRLSNPRFPMQEENQTLAFAFHKVRRPGSIVLYAV